MFLLSLSLGILLLKLKPRVGDVWQQRHQIVKKEMPKMTFAIKAALFGHFPSKRAKKEVQPNVYLIGREEKQRAGVCRALALHAS